MNIMTSKFLILFSVLSKDLIEKFDKSYTNKLLFAKERKLLTENIECKNGIFEGGPNHGEKCPEGWPFNQSGGNLVPDFAANFGGSVFGSDFLNGGVGGKQGNAPEKQGTAPAKQGNTPEKQGTAPVKQGNTTGKQGNTPVKQGNTPEKQGTAPAKQGNTTGKQGNTQNFDNSSTMCVNGEFINGPKKGEKCPDNWQFNGKDPFGNSFFGSGKQENKKSSNNTTGSGVITSINTKEEPNNTTNTKDNRINSSNKVTSGFLYFIFF